MDIQAVAYTHTDAVALIAQVQQEYVIRYGEQDATPVDPAQFAPPLGLFLVGYLDGEAVACGGWRRPADTANSLPGDVELKRMYVAPQARNRGLAREILAALERTATEAGHTRLILETGDQQPEAIKLYTSAGYTEVVGFGTYKDYSSAVHLGKLLVVSDQPANAQTA
ncbi:acetyltransferase (GNAT) family protein [Herbihabitans rhizosphaerae]|uniref:Acetyltransferase (GNAT) family protein n=1 Tax=Herbihabitans rhizosphaerae TaxID=1872711 RepID=A0A4Q7KQZ0_9PSEU|nr:GNAT family N-acetyltransferase [Herbihabitans rhizosphaerae]RZS39278.1 acetyltransferase (GNAT) family protein [Herbihabitans rhizosphaerae]